MEQDSTATQLVDEPVDELSTAPVDELPAPVQPLSLPALALIQQSASSDGVRRSWRRTPTHRPHWGMKARAVRRRRYPGSSR
jgi:hypothetical protein